MKEFWNEEQLQEVSHRLPTKRIVLPEKMGVFSDIKTRLSNALIEKQLSLAFLVDPS